jgi:hypothetical protein
VLVHNLQPTREVVRPANQLPLSEAELQEEVAKMLTANNPAAPQNLARFNMKERSYKFEPMVEQHVRTQPGNRGRGLSTRHCAGSAPCGGSKGPACSTLHACPGQHCRWPGTAAAVC